MPVVMQDLATPPSAIVTGAASGIGRALARMLLARGAEVVAVDRVPPDLPAGPRLTTVVGDLTEPAVRRRVAATVADRPDGLGALAAVAGLYRPSRLETLDPAALDELFTVNVSATAALLELCTDALVRGNGAVVTVSSTFGHRASRTGGGYGASKAAVEGLTRAWARTLHPRVRVNAVAPGPTETPILAAAGMSEAAIATQRVAERERVPLRRLGTPDEVAGWIARLCAPGALTGQVISVDGGLSCA